MFDSMMDMSVSTWVIVGLVLLLIVVAAFFVMVRVLGGRKQEEERHPSRTRSRRGPQRRRSGT